MQEISLLNIASVVWFFLLWLGYARFARIMAKKTETSLSAIMNQLRKRWMEQMLKRDVRIPDASFIANLERSVTFLASSSMLILAALLTALAATDTIQTVLKEVPFYIEESAYMLHLKLALLILIYVYAFFTFSWSVRQYGFATVVIGGAPLAHEIDFDSEKTKQFICSSAKVIDLAAHTYNYGLRAYYFSLAALAWLVNGWIFMGATTLIVIVLYMREFHSRPLLEMRLLQE